MVRCRIRRGWKSVRPVDARLSCLEGAVNYVSNGRRIRIGDFVLLEGDKGIVVCDYDQWECLSGYEGWLTKEELVGGGFLSSGVMIETAGAGMVHYPELDDEIEFVARAGVGLGDDEQGEHGH